MKTILRFGIWMTILSVAFATGTHAQNTFFPTKTGAVLLYAQKDAKGKPSSYSKLTIKAVEGSGSNMTISYVMETLTKDRKSNNPPSETPCKMVIKNGVMILDMNQLFSGVAKDPQAKIEVSGMPMELPGNLQPGQALKDADVTMSIDMTVMKMNMSMKMTDGKCLAIEDVTVPAGTFKCYKITQTVATTVMGKTVSGRSLSWYAPGIGSVKSESYNDKDQLLSSQELAEMN